ncbi:MAG: formimidoylglutamase, partial [Bacteroidota bacterium]
MSLSLFFRPVDPTVYEWVSQQNTVFKAIDVFTSDFPNYAEADIALVGLCEHRGSEFDEGVERAADAIRQAFYRLKKGSGAYKIADLGNLVNGHSLEETYGRLREVCETLINYRTLPVIIGGSHDLDYGQYQAYETMEKLISVLCVDAFIDIDRTLVSENTLKPNQHHLHQILMHDPNYLLNYSHLGYQSYLVDAEVPALLDKFYFDSYRLGLVNQGIATMEPIIRSADMLSIDISAIKSADAPGHHRAQPFGLTGQEACQLCWYAGHSERLTSAGFYEYNPDFDDERQTTAAVIAVMIWYLIEGYYHRTYEENFESNDFTKYLVPMSSSPEQITFYKAKKSE